MMSASIFYDKTQEPTRDDLEKVLGDSAILFNQIEETLLHQWGEITLEWKFYGKKAGWTLAVVHKGRRVFHLIPQAGLFTVVFTLGQRGVAACLESDLPEEILTEIAEAREYAEGKSFRFDVTTRQDVGSVQRLIAIKLNK